MITPSEFIAWWGEDNLMPYEPSAFNGVQLAETSKQFLIEAGLPQQAGLDLEFDLPANQLFTLPEAFDADPVAALNHYRAIGLDSATAICLDELDGWRLYAVDIDGVIPTRFMNSSVPQLAEFLLVFRNGAGLPLPELASEEELEASALALEQEFRRIDPSVFSDEDNWWSLIVEQRRDGML